MAYIDMKFPRSKFAFDIIDLYLDTKFLDDLDQIAWNLCDCDKKRQEIEIGKFGYDGYIEEQTDEISVKIDLSSPSPGNNPDKIQQTITDLVVNFTEYIRPIIIGYKSDDGDTDFSGTPSDWSIDYRD